MPGLDQHGRGVREVGELELRVLVVEQLLVGDIEDAAVEGGELGASHLAQLGVGGCGAPMRLVAGLAVGEADDRGFDAAPRPRARGLRRSRSHSSSGWAG